MKGNTRHFGRFSTELKAHCNSGTEGASGRNCTVINMSRKGIGIMFHSPENIRIGIPVQLDVIIPEKSEPTRLTGVLKWTEERAGALFGGIECVELLDEMKFSKLE